MADTFVVRVKPGSRKGPLVEVGSDGELTIYVREPAVDGKANNAVIRLLAAHLQCQKAEWNWCPERHRGSSVSASAAKQIILQLMPALVDRCTINREVVDSATRRLLRRLDHQLGPRPLQGNPRV